MRDKKHFLFLAAFQFTFHARHQSMNCNVHTFIATRQTEWHRAMVRTISRQYKDMYVKAFI